MNENDKIDFLDRCFDSDFCTNENFLILRELCRDSDSYIRSQASSALINFENEEAKNLLLQLSRDDDSLVRTEAYDSLSNFPFAGVEHFLFEAVKTETDSLARSYAINSWADVSVSLGSCSNRLIDAVMQMKSKENNDHCRLAFCYALYNFGDNDVLSEILGFLKNSDYQIRCSAISILSEIANKENDAIIKQAIGEMMAFETALAVKSTAERCFPRFCNILNDVYKYYPCAVEFESICEKNEKNHLRKSRICDRDKVFESRVFEDISDIFGGYAVVNWTDYKSCCCEFKILLHENQPLPDDDLELIGALGGERRDLLIFVSILEPYYYILAEEAVYSQNNDEWYFNKIHIEDEKIGRLIERLQNYFIENGYTELLDEEVKIHVPSVQTELRNIEEATVFDCLFTNLFKII